MLVSCTLDLAAFGRFNSVMEMYVIGFIISWGLHSKVGIVPCISILGCEDMKLRVNWMRSTGRNSITWPLLFGSTNHRCDSVWTSVFANFQRLRSYRMEDGRRMVTFYFRAVSSQQIFLRTSRPVEVSGISWHCWLVG